ncbi:hypothetical protein Vlu01_38440 [Micromonospora lutea]|uniref:Uncharacterized protein n=1 Tax=Micromonospora lutea TaxID=419825 RepID=A0ABQ4IZ84_9ACTN|nr:hypothetical protein Vlu01_38440 [Micromonospora lutea]
MSPADATTFQTFATISARISSAIFGPFLAAPATYPIMGRRPVGAERPREQPARTVGTSINGSGPDAG